MQAIAADAWIRPFQILAHLDEHRVVHPDVAQTVPAQLPETQLRHVPPDAAQGHFARAEDA